MTVFEFESVSFSDPSDSTNYFCESNWTTKEATAISVSYFIVNVTHRKYKTYYHIHKNCKN